MFRYFGGAVSMFRDSGEKQHIRKTKHKDRPSDITIQAIKETRVRSNICGRFKAFFVVTS